MSDEAKKEEKHGQDLLHYLKDSFVADDVFYSSEVQANALMAKILLISGGFLVIAWVLDYMHIFLTDPTVMTRLVITGLLEIGICYALWYRTKGDNRWIKFVLILGYMLVLSRLDAVLTYNVPLLMALPVILSCRYYSTRLTGAVSVLTAVFFGFSALWGVYFGSGSMDLNFTSFIGGSSVLVDENLKSALRAVGVDTAATMKNIILQMYLPKLMIFSLIAIVCILVTRRSRAMILEQTEITKKSERIESELNLAADIQMHMLPCIFPPFPNHDEVDIYASMNPAKEVGGDFYDLFMVDDKTICFLIADVSGKGVPAALFMVITKTLLKNEAQNGSTPAEVFTRVNQLLCEGNEAGLFVTSWMGYLNTETGLLTYVNAGHNPPLIRQKGGNYEYLRSRPGFVLAGMEGLRYRQNELMLEPGDEIYLYTDGITEAINHDGAMYGEDRLKESLNCLIGCPSQAIIEGIAADGVYFAGDTEQFDDMTMLALRYLSRPQEEETLHEKAFEASVDDLHDVMGFVEEEMEALGCSMKMTTSVGLCVEEIFVNIASYAYNEEKGQVFVAVGEEDGSLVIRFKDKGIPFDPLLHQDPDITLSAEARDIGGLGIFIVKKTMDETNYVYENGCNILVIKKTIG